MTTGPLLAPRRWTDRFFTGSWEVTSRELLATEPATGAELGRVGAASTEHLASCSARAADAARDWAASPCTERARVLAAATELLQRHHDELLGWLVREAGEVRAAAELELASALGELRQAIALAAEPLARTLGGADELEVASRVALGVVAVATSWYFPLLGALEHVAPALACGNSVILRPAPETVVCGGVAIARLFEEAGLPAGVLHVVCGSPGELDPAIASNEHIALMCFGGPAGTQRRLKEALSRGPTSHCSTRTLGAPGGSNAFLVLDDAPVRTAAHAGASAAFTREGQLRMVAGRQLVAASIVEEYLDHLAALAEGMTVGDPRSDVHLGPMISDDEADRLEDLVRECVELGAEVRAGNRRVDRYWRP
ncbi:MAG: xylC, partial [Acidimicrobiaceae bacterium]|nr:xylC [Acidimicrobiaceae bacterium]